KVAIATSTVVLRSAGSAGRGRVSGRRPLQAPDRVALVAQLTSAAMFELVVFGAAGDRAVLRQLFDASIARLAGPVRSRPQCRLWVYGQQFGRPRFLREVEVRREVAQNLHVLADGRSPVGSTVRGRIEALTVEEVVFDELD